MDTFLGCSFGCVYCYAKNRGGNYRNLTIKPANPDHIINYFKHSKRKCGGVISQMIDRRVPIHMGGMTDPFQTLELKWRVTEKVLKYLCQIKYPIVISTKSTIPTQEPYLSLLKSNPNVLIQVSLSTVIDKISAVLEPHSPSPSKRLQAMEILERNGLKTACRWQPYFPYSELNDRQFVESIANTGTKFLTLEHLKLPIEKRTNIYLDKDYREVYITNGATKLGRELVLSADNKISTIERIRSQAHAYNLQFGAADNEFHHYSDTDCCCAGVASLAGFENWFKFQISYAIIKSHGHPFDFSILNDEWKPSGLINRHINSHSRLNRKNKSFGTMEDYLKVYWNNTESVFNPTKYYGVKLLNADMKRTNIYCWS
jgi:DNA repair photolyase